MNAVNDHHVLFVYLAKLMTLHLYVYTWIILCARVVGVGLNVPRSGPKLPSVCLTRRTPALPGAMGQRLISQRRSIFRKYVCKQRHPHPHQLLHEVGKRCISVFPTLCLIFAECSYLSLDLALTGKCTAMYGVLVSQFLVNQALIQTQIVQ